LRQAVPTMARSLLRNWRMRHSSMIQSPVLITTEALADQLVSGKWTNRMADPFAEVADTQSLVLIDQHEWQWHFPRHNRRTYLHAPLQFWTGMAAKFAPADAARGQAREVAALVRERANSLLGWDMGPSREIAFAGYIGRKLLTMPLRYRAYRKLFGTIRPQVLLNSSGCYGQIAAMLAAANDMGIVTAEFQHGAVSDGHDAYNFAPTLRSDDRFRRVLPTYYLSYGDWWNERINAPVEKLSIGYPARARKLAALDEARTERNAVLILGDGVELDLYLDLARKLRDRLAGTGLEVVFRPHPIERTTAIQRYGQTAGGVRIDDGFDIYQAFRGAHAVISEVSTGLFEAVGLVERILMLDTAKARFAYPVHPFTVVTSLDGLAQAIISEDGGRPAVSPERLWAEDWQSSYMRFLATNAKIAGLGHDS